MSTAVVKEIWIIVVTTLLSVITFFASALLLPSIATERSGILWLVILGSLWSVTTVVAYSLNTQWWARVLTVLVPTVAVMAAGSAATGALGGAVLFLLALVLAQQTQRRDIQDRIKYRVTTAFSAGLRLTVIGFLLALAGMSLPFVEQTIREEGLRVSEKQVDTLLQPFEPLLERLTPGGLSANTSIDDLIDQQVAAQLPPGTELTEEQRAALREQLAGQFQLAEDTTGSESLATIVAGQVNNALRDFTEGQALLVTLAIIVLAFLTLRPFVPLLVLLLLPLVSLVVVLLRKTGFVAIQQRTETIERLMLGTTSNETT